MQMKDRAADRAGFRMPEGAVAALACGGGQEQMVEES
jgi:hypothetical protein